MDKQKFLERYPDLESFKRDFPVGHIFKFFDRKWHEIRGYQEDEFPDGEKVNLVILRTFTRYKDGKKWIRHWSYEAKEIYDFYCVYDFCKREFKHEVFTKDKWETHDNEIK